MSAARPRGAESAVGPLSHAAPYARPMPAARRPNLARAGRPDPGRLRQITVPGQRVCPGGAGAERLPVQEMRTDLVLGVTACDTGPGPGPQRSCATGGVDPSLLEVRGSFSIVRSCGAVAGLQGAVPVLQFHQKDAAGRDHQQVHLPDVTGVRCEGEVRPGAPRVVVRKLRADGFNPRRSWGTRNQ